MRRLGVAALLLIAVMHCAAALEAGPVERHMRGIKAGIYKLSNRSFVARFADGAVREQFTIKPDSYAYTLFDQSGVKLVQWERKNNGQIIYERWYSPTTPKERLLEDDRSISYTSFYKNGKKWEQYTYNKQKRIKSYDVYDRNGHLLRGQ